MEDKIKIFKALGDETRINILHLINKKSMCAKGIARELSISESAVSQQIKVLKDSNLVIGYKIGYHIVYDLNIEQLESINILIDYIVNDDNNIKTKENILNNNKDYQEYLSKLKDFNNTLLASSSLIEDYVTDKVSI